ncbi:MAG TPA: hypothetical protein VHL52_04695 [Acidimicrobiia bacterium]|nr:hypothetical protein [Acidimicrobiia bacterium]
MERDALVDALEAAASAHHEYETVALGGQRDEIWAGFYAAYVLGRLGDFMKPSELAATLEAVDGEPWAEAAADAVLA